MSGIRVEHTAVRPGDHRKRLIEERDARMLQWMREGLPVSTIRELEGLDHDNCRKICRSLAHEHDLDYNVDHKSKPKDGRRDLPEGLGEESQPLRRKLGDVLAKLRNVKRLHQLEIARDTGVTQRSQGYAMVAPFTHNWSISQIERLAKALGTPFKLLMLEVILDRDEFEAHLRAMKSVYAQREEDRKQRERECRRH